MTEFWLRFWIILVIFATFYTKAVSQALVPDTSYTPAVKNAIDFYSTLLKEQLHLFNGKEYKEYSHPFDEGHPFFMGE